MFAAAFSVVACGNLELHNLKLEGATERGGMERACDCGQLNGILETLTVPIIETGPV